MCYDEHHFYCYFKFSYGVYFYFHDDEFDFVQAMIELDDCVLCYNIL